MQRHTGRDMWDVEECQSPRMGSVILGVDGGASNTVCVCIPAAMPFNDPLPVLSRTVAGCSNHNSVGGNTILERVMSQALLKARRRRSNVCAVCLAVAGVNHPIDQERMLDWLRSFHSSNNRWTYEDQSWARIADLLPVVVESAESGDEVANKILHNSVGELASSVKAVVQRLQLGGEGNTPVLSDFVPNRCLSNTPQGEQNLRNILQIMPSSTTKYLNTQFQSPIAHANN